MSELKPCPFCGVVPDPEDDTGFLHKGADCFIETMWVHAHEYDDWNRRAGLPEEMAVAGEAALNEVVLGRLMPLVRFAEAVLACHRGEQK